MDNLKILCAMCEEFSRLVRVIATHLAQLGDTSMTDEIAAADKRYRAVLGIEDAPVCAYPSQEGGTLS